MKLTDQEGRFSTTAYDNEGRITSATDGAGNVTVYTYDESANTYASSRQPVRIDYPTYATTFTYDVMGRVVTETDIGRGSGRANWLQIHDILCKQPLLKQLF